tara:strand:- start:614 stop:973 length:360 start_codon:yes stop_codon:yes gene_type:complete
MKIKRAIGYGIVLWLLIFVWWSILVMTPALEGMDSLQWLIHIILLIPAAIFCAHRYYQKKDKTNGFLLGFVFLLTGTVLDLAITAPFFTGYTEFYSSPFLWIGFAVMICTVGIYKLVKK